MAAVNDVPHLVDKKGGSYAAIAPKLEPRNFNKWKKPMLCYLAGIEPYYLKCIKYDPFQPKTPDGDAKPNLFEKWLTFSQGLRNANHTQTLDLADIYGRFVYEDNLIQRRYSDTKKTLITTPSSTPISTAFFSNNVIQDFQENSDDEVDERTSEEYLRDLDIEYHERALLANSKRFIKRRNNFSGQKNENIECYKCGNKCYFARDYFSKTSEPSYKSPVNNYSLVSKGFQPKFTPKLIQSSSNSNNQADQKFQKDYKAEYKKMKAKLSLLEASPSSSQNPKTFQPKNKGLVTETFDWDEEEVSDEEKVTQVKVLIALANDELTVRKSHAHNGKWVDITIRKVNTLLSKDEDADWQNYLKYINIDLKFVEEQRLNLLSKYNKMVFELNKGRDEFLILKQAKLDAEKKINEKWLTSSKKVSQCISEQIPHQKNKVIGCELLTESSSKRNKNEIFSFLLPWVPKSQVVNESLETSNTSESTKDSEAEFLTPLPPLKILQGASPSSEDSSNESVSGTVTVNESKQTTPSIPTEVKDTEQESKLNELTKLVQMLIDEKILRAKVKSFPPCTHYGFNDHIPDDYRNYPECGICGSYYNFTSGHNRVIQIKGGVLAESSQSNNSSIRFDDKQRTIFNANKEIVLIAPRRNDVYVLDMSSLTPNGACFFAKASESVNWLWHKRLSHLNFKNINKLSKQNKVLGLPSLVYSKDKPCTAWEKGKHHIASFKTKQNFFTRKCLHLLHMDLFGPVNPMSINHEKYTLVIVDEYSRERIPDISYFHVFGCLVFIHNHKDHLGKFDAKADDGYFLGYSSISKAFRVYNTRRQQIEETYHVTFDESMEAIWFTNTSVDEIGIDDSSRYLPDEFQEDDPSRQYQDRWSRDQNIKLVNIIGNLGESMLTRSMAAKLTAALASECLFADFLSEIEPKKVFEALKHPGWIDAMQEELNQFYRNKVWILVPLPYGKIAIGSKWVFKNKKDKHGTTTKNKARLVEQGYSQEEGIDYDETFALVARTEAIRIFLAFATYMNFKVYQMDVKSAFLNCKLKEEVYVKQPPGFESSEFPDYVCKLDKALYGLKQAPRAWYETLSTFLIQNKFVRGRTDNTLFIYKSKGEVLLVQDCKSSRMTKGISICQEQYTRNLLKKYEIFDSSLVKTPMVPPNKLGLDLAGKSVNETSYIGMIGSLMYLTVTRPDIQFSTVLCARYQSNPKESHLIALKRILKYLKGTPTLGLYSPTCSGFDLKGYSDSDYAGCNMDRKGTSGAYQILGGKLVCWSAKKQQSVAMSSVEAEYVAAAGCCASILWMKSQLSDYDIYYKMVLIFCDNTSAIAISNNPVLHSRTKHIDIRYHFIRDHILKGDIELHFIPIEY
ncbi:retrovirus-related pol polyprotein from transposon TNT 1-94 [Tanacetum coccineum]